MSEPFDTLECEVCHRRLKDVTSRINPYEQEINDKEVVMLMCDDCYQSSLDDI